MAHDVARDQVAVIHIEGMHSHRCEQTVKRTISAKPGVFEVEVDFNSRQASVLFDPAVVKVSEFLDAVTEAGYRAVGFTEGASK